MPVTSAKGVISMANKAGNELCIIPMSNYKPPSLPNLQSAKPGMLKKLPSRWKKNASVIACIGMMGVISLSSCSPGGRFHNGGAGAMPFYVVYPIESETEVYTNGGYEDDPIIRETSEQLVARLTQAELDSRMHWGGSGAGPFYVVSITEQEVFGFIRAKLEAAGLDLKGTPPENTVESWADTHSIDLFDDVRNVAVTHLSWDESNRQFSATGQWLATEIAKDFMVQMENVSVGVFYNPGSTLARGDSHWDEENEELVTIFDVDEVSPEAKEEAREQMIENLTNQVQTFITWLQDQGII